jgi:hypothetical protein
VELDEVREELVDEGNLVVILGWHQTARHADVLLNATTSASRAEP